MELGPLQLMVIAFDHPDFRGDIAREIIRLSDTGMVRLLDALVVFKGADGVVQTALATELATEEMQELGAKIGALIGLGFDGEDGATAGAELGQAAGADGHLLDDLDAVDVLQQIPPDSTAAVVLLEHRWAIPLRDAIVSANGMPVVDMWIHPLELVAIGALAGAEDDE